MDPQAPARIACRELVAGHLRSIFGERLVVDERSGSFGIREGSAWVTVRVDGGSDDAPLVVTRAFLVSGAEPSQEFLHFLLAEDGRPPVGAYGLDARDDVFLEHAVPGDGITAAQVRASVQGIAEAADRADDAIVARFGGIRMTDPRPKSD
jgi:hypothetical protein